jgi:hypothetical protein
VLTSSAAPGVDHASVTGRRGADGAQTREHDREGRREPDHRGDHAGHDRLLQVAGRHGA